MKICFYLFLLFGLLTSCQSQLTKPFYPANENLYFPKELYKQLVKIEYQENNQSRSATFQGALKKSSTELVITAISPVGLTLFTLKDNFKGDIKLETSFELDSQKQKMILKLYPAIRKAYFLKKDSVEVLNQGFDENVGLPIGTVHVAIQNQQVSIEKQPYFKVTIENLP